MGTHIPFAAKEAAKTGKTTMNVHTAPLPFAPSEAPPSVLDRPISRDPLSAHEKLAAAALAARIGKARNKLVHSKTAPWIMWPAYDQLYVWQLELADQDPFTVRLRLRYPPTLPRGV